MCQFLAFSLTCNNLSPLLADNGEPVAGLKGRLLPLGGLFLWILAFIISQASMYVLLQSHGTDQRLAKLSKDMLAEFTCDSSDHLKISQIQSDAVSLTWNSSPTSADEVDPRDFMPFHTNIFLKNGPTQFQIVGFRHGTNSVAIVVGSIAFVLLLISFSLPLLQFNGSGLIVGDSITSTRYSLARTLGLLVRNAADSGTGFAFYTLATCLVVIGAVLLVPLLQLTTTLVLWVYPMSMPRLVRLKRVYDILETINLVDVFMLATVGCAAFAPGIMSYLVVPFSLQFRFAFESLVSAGFLDANDAYAFAVESTVAYGSILLLAAIALMAILRAFTSEAVTSWLEMPGPDYPSHKDSLTSGGRVTRTSSRDTSNAYLVKRLKAPKFYFANRYNFLMIPSNDERVAQSAYA